MPDIPDTILSAFKSENPDVVLYVSECCGRRYIGLVPASKCRTCDKLPAIARIA